MQPDLYQRGGRTDLPSVQTSMGVLYLEQADPYVDGNQQANTLIEWWHLACQHKWKLAGMAVLGMIAGAAVTLMQTPIYRAQATIEIEPLGEDLFKSADAAIDAPLQTQVRLLQSVLLRRRAADRLRQDAFMQPPATFFGLRKALRRPEPTTLDGINMAVDSTRAVVLGATQIVELSCESTNPAIAAAYVNDLASEFTDYNTAGRWQSGQKTKEWLDQQVDEVRTRLHTSESRLQKMAGSWGLVYGGNDKDTVEQQRLRQLQGEFVAAQMDRISKQAVLEVAKNTPLDAVPQVADSERLGAYRTKLAELHREYAELSSALTPEHYKLVRIQAQISELEQILETERATIMARIENDFRAAQTRETLLASRYDLQNGIVAHQGTGAVDYNLLLQEVNTDRQLYDSMMQKVQEVDINMARRVDNIRIVDAAKEPRRPILPTPASNLGLGACAGWLLGFGVLVGASLLDRTVRSPTQVASSLRLSPLGVIPRASDLPRRRLSAASQGGSGRLELATWQNSQPALAEAFRMSLASILFSAKKNQVLLFTSTASSDGKTTVATNLGVASSEIGRRVVVIDGDLRRPRLHQVFQVPNTWGLTDLLRDLSEQDYQRCPLEALVKPTALPGLYLIPSGPAAVSAANLLYSSHFGALLDRLRTEFDTILIDAPPMTHLPDARFLARLADGVVLVVRAGVTSCEAARVAKERLVSDGASLLGIILTHWRPRSQEDKKYYEEYCRLPMDS